MKTWIAILFTIGLLVVCGVISVLAGFPFSWIMVPITALWAAIDSKKIQLKHYKSGISYGPVGLFFGIVLLWFIGFPWYLAMRYKIKTGTAILKEPSSEQTASAPDKKQIVEEVEGGTPCVACEKSIR